MTEISEVDHWFEDLDHPLADALQRARQLILGADDRVTETIKWSTPTFAYKGNILSFNPSKTAISLMFHRGAEIPGHHPRLEGEGICITAGNLTTDAWPEQIANFMRLVNAAHAHRVNAFMINRLVALSTSVTVCPTRSALPP